jgi:hypothetical protein
MASVNHAMRRGQCRYNAGKTYLDAGCAQGELLGARVRPRSFVFTPFVRLHQARINRG